MLQTFRKSLTYLQKHEHAILAFGTSITILLHYHPYHHDYNQNYLPPIAPFDIILYIYVQSSNQLHTRIADEREEAEGKKTL